MRVVRWWSCSSQYCRAQGYGSPVGKTQIRQSCWCSMGPGVPADVVLCVPCLAQVLPWWLLCCWLGLRAVWARGWACPVVWHVPVTPRTPPTAPAHFAGRRARVGEGWGAVQQQAVTVPQGFYFFCWPKSDMTLGGPSVCLPLLLVHSWRDSTWAVWPATSCWGSSQVSLVLVLSTLLCRVIPAQRKPRELLSFACLSWCGWLMAAHG